jgi:DNA-binding transcriptional MerR regulator
VSDENLLGIGAFALLSGLTISALRHYDEIELLRPARVDISTRYRYYGPEQVHDAQLVRALRAIDLPLNEIKDVLERRDDASTRAYLVTHRHRLSARAEVLSDQLAVVDQLHREGSLRARSQGKPHRHDQHRRERT